MVRLNICIIALLCFVAGLTELVISGILPYVAQEFSVSIATAGQSVTIFAFIFAVSGPLIIACTTQFNRKKLFISFILIFIIGNVLTLISTTFFLFMLSRIILAIGVSMIIALSLSLSVKLVPIYRQSRVISILTMSISTSLVLGIPMGIIISEYFGWKAIFIFVTVACLIILVLIMKYFPGDISIETVTFMEQSKALLNKHISFAHLTTFFFFTGQSMFYIYFTPFIQDELGYSAGTSSMLYLVYGICAVFGGAVSGALVERVGATKTLIIVILIYILMMLSISITSNWLALLIINTGMWGMLSWSINTPQQTYLIHLSPKYASFNQTFSTSTVQFGIAMGSFLGAVLLESMQSYYMLIVLGSAIVAVGFICLLVSLKGAKQAEL
ncbi:MFS transporter [Staphylococcus caeli]|uniref:MFS transporter n=1 Tax=Staphylococcus caeli TaxID=2201815 RepID=UPI003F57B35A